MACIPSVSGAGCIDVSCCGVDGCCGVVDGVNGGGCGIGCGGVSGCSVISCGVAPGVTGTGGGADSNTAEFFLGFLRYLSLNGSFFLPGLRFSGRFLLTHGFRF